MVARSLCLSLAVMITRLKKSPYIYLRCLVPVLVVAVADHLHTWQSRNLSKNSSLLFTCRCRYSRRLCRGLESTTPTAPSCVRPRGMNRRERNTAHIVIKNAQSSNLIAVSNLQVRSRLLLLAKGIADEIIALCMLAILEGVHERNSPWKSDGTSDS
jgi:hypothetical protein